jgi:DUF917 family protein
MIAVGELPDDALVVTIGVLGGPAWPDDAAWLAAARTTGEQAGQRVAAVLPLGAHAVLATLHAASVLGVPGVDADAAGRGAGKLDLTLLALGGLAAEPVVAGRGGTEVVAVRRAGSAAAQRIAAAVAADLGGAAVVAYPAPAARYADLVSACAGRSGGDLLFTGSVADVAGDRRRTATIAAGERQLRLDYQDTYLVATESGVVRAATPDLICVLDTDRGTPVPTAALDVGSHVRVVVVPAEPRWLLQDGLAAAGPRRFGYDVDHVRTTGNTASTHGGPLEIGS